MPFLEQDNKRYNMLLDSISGKIPDDRSFHLHRLICPGIGRAGYASPGPLSERRRREITLPPNPSMDVRIMLDA